MATKSFNSQDVVDMCCEFELFRQDKIMERYNKQRAEMEPRKLLKFFGFKNKYPIFEDYYSYSIFYRVNSKNFTLAECFVYPVANCYTYDRVERILNLALENTEKFTYLDDSDFDLLTNYKQIYG